MLLILERWKEYRVPPELLEKSRRMERAYLKMGTTRTWTCAPYQQGMIPRFGEQIAWGESNAIAFANSIIGARTNRCIKLKKVLDISPKMIRNAEKRLWTAKGDMVDLVVVNATEGRWS